VEIYSTNVTLNGGDIGLGGGDIRDSGVTVWNSSQGFVPAASVEVNPIQSGTTASDVGLGQVENEAQVAESGDTLSGSLNLGGNDLTSSGTTLYDSANGFVPASSVEKGPIQSGTSASDVGLGNVLNKEQLAVDGSNSMTTSLDVGGHKVINTQEVNHQTNPNDNSIEWDELGSGSIVSDGVDEKYLIVDAEDGMSFRFDSDRDSGGDYECGFDGSDGSFECEGAKNWVHDLNQTHNAVYSSQESPEVRAVYEGQAATSNGRVNVSLPSHFSKTVSDTRPLLRVQVTPHSLASVAVTERTDDYLVVESSKDVTVDFRVTGIREGYEDKQVVEKK